MARAFEHLELPVWKQPLPKRPKNGSGRGPGGINRYTHGHELISQAGQVVNHLQERIETSPKGINPKLIFKLQLHKQGHLDEKQLRRLGLEMLARDSNKAIVVFPDEATLAELRRHLSEYAGLIPDGHDYAFLASVATIEELTPDDRIGQRLRNRRLSSDEVMLLDIELWHTGDENECWEKIDELQTFLKGQGLNVTDKWVGDTICLLRAEVHSSVLETLLSIDYIREIERRPTPTFEMLPLNQLSFDQIEFERTLPENLIGVLIVDSGVMQRHPLLGPFIGDAQAFPRRLLNAPSVGAEDMDEKSEGHGTAVAGIAIYNNVGECITSRKFEAQARLFSAQVTDRNNEFDEKELLEHQLEEAVTYFLSNYSSVKVINISLGSSNHAYSDEKYQFRFAAAIDALAYRYRDHEVVFVVSSGNFMPQDEMVDSDEEIFKRYPLYLFDSNRSRIIDLKYPPLSRQWAARNKIGCCSLVYWFRYLMA